MKKLTKEQMEIVKREHPSWFNGIEVGKWYKNKSNVKSIIFNTGVKNGCYGFSNSGKWTNEYEEVTLTNLWEEATPEEVRSALIAEAKRRYKVGDRIKSIRNDWVHTICEMHVDVYSLTKERNYWVVTVVAEEYEWSRMCSNPAVFKDGQWASVLTPEKPTLQDDIQAIKDRWPDINFTIIAEGKR